MSPLQLGVLIPQSSVVNPCFVEQFASGLTPYTVISGNGAIYGTTSTAYGTAVTIASQNAGTPAIIRRPASNIAVRTISGKFNVSENQPDDAGLIGAVSAGLGIFSVNPRRETAIDAQKRCDIRLTLAGGGLDVDRYIGAGGEIVVGNWYQIDITIIAGAGNTTVVVTRLSDSVIVINTTLPGSYAAATIDSLQFYSDSGGTTAQTDWADIHFCP